MRFLQVTGSVMINVR